jgi:hypothetical protein
LFKEVKELVMSTGRKPALALYVDRSSQQWVVLDPEGNMWKVPVHETNPWARRQPFYPTDETELQPIPGHYKHMLGLPA